MAIQQRQCQSARHSAWLNRGSTSPLSWRPRIFHRRSSCAWITALEAQYRGGTKSKQGFKRLELREDNEEFKSWETSPIVVIPMDLGPNGVAGLFAMQYRFSICAEGFPDPSHGMHCDLDGAIGAVGLRPVLITGVINSNLEAGPFDEGWRQQQMLEHLRKYCDTHTCVTAVLFQSVVGKLIAEFRALGNDLGDDAHAPQACWDLVCEYSKVGRKYSKICLARFGAGLISVLETTKCWWLMWLERTLCALEEDFLKGKRFNEQLVSLTAAEAVVEGGGPTKAVVNMDSKMMRSSCENGVAIGVVLLSSDTALRLYFIMKVCLSSAMVWLSHVLSQMKCCDECEAWVTDQACGGVARHALEFLHPLTCLKDLEEAKFVTTKVGTRQLGEDMCSEDDYASTFGALCCEMSARRQRRLLWIAHGWPWGMTRVLKDEKFEETLDAFEQDVFTQRHLEAKQDRNAMCETLRARHILKKASCHAFVKAMHDRAQPSFKERIRLVVSKRARVCSGTVIVEEVNGAMKNRKSLRQNTKRRRPQLAVAHVLQSQLFQKRYRYKSVNLEAPVGRKTQYLRKDHFEACASQRSLPYGSIVSTNSAAGHFSPKASDFSVNVADLTLLRDARRMSPDINIVENSWMGCVASVQHCLLIGLPSGAHPHVLDIRSPM